MVSPLQPTSTPTIQHPREAAEYRKLIVAGQIAFLPTGMLTTLLWPMLPILTARWALNDQQAGNLFLIQFLSQLAGVQVSGAMLARVGFRPAFLTGLLLMTVGVGTLYVGAPWLGFVSVAVYGLGLGTIIPTDNLLIAEISSGSRAAAVSLLNFFWGAGAVVCSLLVGWAQARHLIPFLLGGISLLLVLLALGVRNLVFPGAMKSTGSGSLLENPTMWLFPSALCFLAFRWAQSHHSQFVLWITGLFFLFFVVVGIWKLILAARNWQAFLRNPVVWLFALVFFFYPGSETAVGGWIGSYVTRLGMNKTMGALMPALFLTAMTIGRGLAGVILRHLPEQRVLQIGYGFGAAGIGLLISSSTLGRVAASAVVVGFSFAALYPIAVARLPSHFGVQARSIGAVMFSIAAIGPAVLPWLVGMISQTTGNLRSGLAVPLVSIAVLFVAHLKEW